MGYKNVFICDHCGAEEAAIHDLIGEGKPIVLVPLYWFRVRQHLLDEMPAATALLCSNTCLAEWASEKRAQEIEGRLV